jgi:hypothetical protein
MEQLNDPIIDRVLRGGKRLYDQTSKRERLPLTQDILIRIINQLNKKHMGFDEINIYASLCLGFAAFLRSGEFTWEKWNPLQSPRLRLSRKHITFSKDSITIHLPSSKTDPFATGVDIHLSKSPIPSICPVRALKHLFKHFPAPPDAPLFSRSLEQPFSRTHFVNHIKSLLLQAGMDPSKYSGHSLRKGAAVSAKAAGISRDEIKLLGRWKSDAVDTYINELSKPDHKAKMLQLQSQLYLPQAPLASSSPLPLPPPSSPPTLHLA